MNAALSIIGLILGSSGIVGVIQFATRPGRLRGTILRELEIVEKLGPSDAGDALNVHIEQQVRTLIAIETPSTTKDRADYRFAFSSILGGLAVTTLGLAVFNWNAPSGVGIFVIGLCLAAWGYVTLFSVRDRVRARRLQAEALAEKTGADGSTGTGLA